MSDEQCATFGWCQNGVEGHPCRGEHFAQTSFRATMDAFRKSRSRTGVGVIVGTSFTPTEDVVPLISISIGDSTQADLSLYEAKVAFDSLRQAIEVAEPFWSARPDVCAVYEDVEVW